MNWLDRLTAPGDWEYSHWLVVISLAFVLLELLFPWRRKQRLWHVGLLRDLVFLALNGHFFGLLVGWINRHLYPETGDPLQAFGLVPDSSPVDHWPLWAQFVAFLLLSDFLQWCTHNLLHRVPILWQFHKVHHSVRHMYWAANFHFHWMEILVYSAVTSVPLAWLGADYRSAHWVFVVGTAWGHLNHANLNVSLGPLGYLFNSPRMHLWHHDRSAEGGTAKNFGIVLSCWDWLFGTAFWPRNRNPEGLGYPGMEEMPGQLGQLAWPLVRNRPAEDGTLERPS